MSTKSQPKQLHFTQIRTLRQIQLTNQLARSLTEINLKRLAQQTIKPYVKKSNKAQYLYVCITGLPPLNNQYEGIAIPGEKIVIYPEGFQPNLTQQQIINSLKFAPLQIQAQKLHKILEKRTDKKLVFMCHSFGTSIMSALFKFYHKEYKNRVIGIIPIGCYTVSAFGQVSGYVNWASSLTNEYLMGNVDDLYKSHCDFHAQLGIPAVKNRYSYLASLVAFGQGLGFDEMFQYNRQWFPILKCFIYGREDNRIDEPYLNQTAIYYSYQHKLDNEIEKKVKEAYEVLYERKVENVQQRFVFNIQGAKHTIHVQKKYKQLVGKIINSYLNVLEIMF